MTETSESTRGELTRRQRAAAYFVYAMLALTVLLMALAYAGVLIPEFSRAEPVIDMTLRIAIVFFGVGAVVLRRTMFNAARLQDIASLRGTTGLLDTLQKTTVFVALIGGTIAVMGFILSVIWGEREYRYMPEAVKIGLIAVAVLVYAYPRRSAWERVVRLTTPGETPPASPAKGTFS
ncbi:MAG TPA: hypothetical protein VFX96_04050 [Pyrinomonadaceae bacterium]|nr:hypothetical protein [Pyrinomonadaceae bacterium]